MKKIIFIVLAGLCANVLASYTVRPGYDLQATKKLWRYVRHYNAEDVEELILSGADIESRDNEYCTPLLFVVCTSHYVWLSEGHPQQQDALSIIKILLKRGAEIPYGWLSERSIKGLDRVIAEINTQINQQTIEETTLVLNFLFAGLHRDPKAGSVLPTIRRIADSVKLLSSASEMYAVNRLQTVARGFQARLQVQKMQALQKRRQKNQKYPEELSPNDNPYASWTQK